MPVALSAKACEAEHTAVLINVPNLVVEMHGSTQRTPAAHGRTGQGLLSIIGSADAGHIVCGACGTYRLQPFQLP